MAVLWNLWLVTIDSLGFIFGRKFVFFIYFFCWSCWLFGRLITFLGLLFRLSSLLLLLVFL